MRILFSIESMGSGGKERRLNELIKHLSKNPDNKLALVVFHEGFHYKESEKVNLKVYQINKDLKSILTLKPFWQFAHICKEFKPDIIHSWGNLNSLFAIPASYFQGIPVINNQITSVAKSKRSFGKLIYYKIPFAFSKAIVGNSKIGLSSYSVKSTKARSIYNGFNNSRLNKLKPADEVRKELGIKTPFVVGMVASTVPAKDYKTFFNSAFEVLNKRDDVSFVAIGGGVKKKHVENIPKKYSSRILLFEARNHVENDMNIFDIGVLSSFYEGLPNVVLEMMALGKAVIATNVGGTPELIDNMEDGFLFQPGDQTQLVDLINSLLDNEKTRKAIGDNARQKVQAKFDIDTMLAAYENVYREVLTD